MAGIRTERRQGDRSRGRDRTACTLAVAGLDCASCAATVDRALRSVAGVEEVRADVINERVTVVFSAAATEEELRAAVRRAGYRVREAVPASVLTYHIPDLCCTTEARQIEESLGRRPDVDRIAFDYVGRRMTVEGRVAPAQVERAVGRLGMRARRVGVERAVEDASDASTRTRYLVVAAIFWFASILTNVFVEASALTAVLAIGAIVAGGRYIVPRGWAAARSRSLDMNFLMSVAAVGALFIGEYLEAASAMVLFALAQLLEARSLDRARNAIRSLMDFSPVTALVIRPEGEVRVPVDQVAVGEVVVVRPGEKIPVDGEVAGGRSAVNQAPITGESIPVEKEPGAEVYAGTVNGEGALEIRSTRPAEDTTLARIIHSVEEAHALRAPSQTFVDRFARVYTPAVVVIALLIAVVPPLIVGGWTVWIYRALVLLVVACPCALVISTPVTIVSALAGAARRGILIKGGLHLENLGRSRVVALDKTGTLTLGEPTVVRVTGAAGTDPDTVLALAAAAESRSEHPLARAILRHAHHHGIRAARTSESAAVVGRGVRASVNGGEVYVGTERLFRELGVSDGEIAGLAAGPESKGQTVVLVGSTEAGAGTQIALRGSIAIADRLRPEAAEAVTGLAEAGISHIVMLTGDNAGTAEAIASALPGLHAHEAELLPQDKVHAVRRLRDRYGPVTFVGDGINDAPALAAADVGIAMGAAGTDVALETADIALMTDDLRRIQTTIRIARKADTIIRMNIAFSLLTKAAFVAFAVTGWATLWMAVLADMGTSLIVIMNGMRALRI